MRGRFSSTHRKRVAVQGPPLHNIRRCRGIAAAAGPVGVEEFAARFVDALIGVRAEIVARARPRKNRKKSDNKDYPTKTLPQQEYRMNNQIMIIMAKKTDSSSQTPKYILAAQRFRRL